jgi:hypothetical protein
MWYPSPSVAQAASFHVSQPIASGLKAATGLQRSRAAGNIGH